jgi:hypothetical protein
MRKILVATKKERYWGTAGEEKVAHLPQYDSFMGMRGWYWGTAGDALTVSKKIT